MNRTVIVMAWLVLAAAAPALTQVTAPGRGHGMGGTKAAPATPEGEKAAPTTVAPRLGPPATITGKVESLATQPGMGGGMMLQTAVVKTASGSVTVYLGPTGYLERQGFPLKVGDSWEVAGYKSPTGIVAREIKSGGGTLKLRDERGQPLWRGMGGGAERTR